MPFKPISLAGVDRWVAERIDGSEVAQKARVSDLASTTRWVLLGEPGSGKSATLRQTAEASGASVVTARAFVEGERPAGRTVFIDAFEEYRMGELARERLSDLARALKAAPYESWRIACRSISLPPSEVHFLSEALGSFNLWQLEPLDSTDIQTILKHLGEPDPMKFVRHIQAMAAGSLMGNPATLVLLQRTLASGTATIVTRSDLFSTATRQMAHELNDDLPNNPVRPEPGSILAVAETSCLVLLLSGQPVIWSLNKLPNQPCVTLDDLIPAGISTHALMFALDTPMFRGEAGVFMPTHRIVAEYLGGRALARATDPDPGEEVESALSVRRALALLCGAGDRPVPALTGLYAWFVSALAQTQHHRRALELVKADPESILFHGDAAALPTEHRRALLHAVGRKDPWFLSNTWGSTALAGLAGDDIAEELATVVFDPGDTLQRRAMVLFALATGRPVKALSARLFDFAANPSTPEPLRLHAIEAVVHIAEDPELVSRELLTAISSETDGGPLMLRLKLLASLVGVSAGPVELRRVITDYAASADQVMGYARQLGNALVATPLPTLFDEPMPGLHGIAARRIEVMSILDTALVAAINSSRDLPAERLLLWLYNLHKSPIGQLRDEVRSAIQSWLGRDSSSEMALFDAIVRSMPLTRRARVGDEFHRIVGRRLSSDARQTVVERFEAMSALPLLEDVKSAATIACILTSSSDLFDRVRKAIEARNDKLAETLAWLLAPPDDTWREEEDALQEERRAERETRQATDRAWLSVNRVLVQSGRHLSSLVFGAHVALRLKDTLDFGNRDLLEEWFGTEGASDIRAGWAMLAGAFPVSPLKQGEAAAGSTIIDENWVAVAHAVEQATTGNLLPVSLPYAFAVLCGGFLVNGPVGMDAVRDAAIERIVAHTDGREALADFWAEAIRHGAQALPNLSDFETRGPQLALVLEPLLRSRLDAEESLLQCMIQTAFRIMSPDGVLALSEVALSRSLPPHANRLWAFVAFLTAPFRYGPIFTREIADAQNHAVFRRLYAIARQASLTPSSEAAIARDAHVVHQLGPLYGPTDNFVDSSGMGRIVGDAIQSIAQSPLDAAGHALRALSDDGNLSVWREVVLHNRSRQEVIQREALFRTPAPRTASTALRSGPPATSADLRAVVHEVLVELAKEIRDGPTSPWRGFWNRPSGGKKTPKIENDCRDLVADRLGDRLLHYRLPVQRLVSTEARSTNDRRADMVVLGKGAAALPIEVKRHWNRELWTAPKKQLEPYAESLDASGHGIYLVLWFGSYASVPDIPVGVGSILTADALQAALVAHLPPDKVDKFDVVVIDVSDQEVVKPVETSQPKATKGKTRLTAPTARKSRSR